MHERLLAIHKGVDGTFAKALDRVWWKRIRQNVKSFLALRRVLTS
jgi:hypothetical protein